MEIECETCVFWDSEMSVEEFEGACRRHAPTPFRRGDRNDQASWPMTLAMDWCGEHEERN